MKKMGKRREERKTEQRIKGNIESRRKEGNEKKRNWLYRLN